jgi:protein tyrosine/serine phosphatase
MLAWDGLLNVRDLGGLETEDGARTRFGAVIRADNIRRLRAARTLLEHGVTRVVDLRFPVELEEDPIDELPVDVVHVSLLGEWDDEYRGALEAQMVASAPPEYLRWSYLDFLERFKDNFATVMRAIATAPDGAVCVHCMGGRDRTGLVSALLLRLAGVSIETVADDYAASEEALAEAHVKWVEAAPDERERARRSVFGHAPAHVMAEVLEEVERRYGSVRGYLEAAGVAPEELDALRGRLREDSGVGSTEPPGRRSLGGAGQESAGAGSAGAGAQTSGGGAGFAGAGAGT